ncbi:MAG: hypothetical protein GWP03_00055 [Proteobacteria bacterium]|nr:hypothetical protein [Pseudomonadota bacterium]
MSENDYLKKLIKSKKEKSKSPLEKFINKENVTMENKATAVNKPEVEIKHYDGTTQTTETNNAKPYESKQVENTPQKHVSNNSPDSLLKATGLREFDIDALDVDYTEKVANKPATPPVVEKASAQNSVSVTEDEVNQLIGFVKVGNFDAAVDFIVQLKLKYNIDNIL